MQVRLGALIAGALDVAGASPRRFFFEVLRHFAKDERERERLQYFSTPEGRDDLYRYNQREGAVTSICLSSRRTWASTWKLGAAEKFAMLEVVISCCTVCCTWTVLRGVSLALKALYG